MQRTSGAGVVADSLAAGTREPGGSDAGGVDPRATKRRDRRREAVPVKRRGDGSGFTRLEKIAYKPVGLALGLLSGLLAGKVFELVWKKVARA
jgi:hypothetical protein